MTDLDSGHVEWCKNFFEVLAEGAAWGIPRSGLLFRKRGKSLIMVACMPHVKEMPITAEQLSLQQEADYTQTKLHFGAAGIEVSRTI